MTRMTVLAAVALAGAAFAGPASAQEVITNPGKCAQFYPNANCQNYGPGNPYRGSYSYQNGYRGDWRNGYAWDRRPDRWHRRYRY